MLHTYANMTKIHHMENPLYVHVLENMILSIRDILIINTGMHKILNIRGVPIIRLAVLSVGNMNNKVLSVIEVSLRFKPS